VNDGGLFFFHNPKAGGTAVGTVLAAMFAPELRCPLIENTERDHARLGGHYAPFRGYRYYGGHYGRDIFNAVSDGHRAITNFRDPQARLRSLYTYYRLVVKLPENANLLDDLYPVAFAQSHDFHSFVATEDPRIEIHTRNHHVRQLTMSAWSPGSVGDLEQAMAFVDLMPWYYVCELAECSQLWGRRVFGGRFTEIRRENVTAGAYDSPPEMTRRIIEEKNALDRSLHEFAARKLRHSMRRGPARRVFSALFRRGPFAQSS
jgi:hypothetical protein